MSRRQDPGSTIINTVTSFIYFKLKSASLGRKDALFFSKVEGIEYELGPGRLLLYLMSSSGPPISSHRWYNYMPAGLEGIAMVLLQSGWQVVSMRIQFLKPIVE